MPRWSRRLSAERDDSVRRSRPSERAVCESQTLTCLTAEAETVCNAQGIVDGEVCSGVNFVGICQRQLCLPGCGDGAIEQGIEECDDGNFRSHDG